MTRLEDLRVVEDRIGAKYGETGSFLVLLLQLTGREIDEAPSEHELDFAAPILGAILARASSHFARIQSDKGAPDSVEVKAEKRRLHLEINQALGAIGREVTSWAFFEKVYFSRVVSPELLSFLAFFRTGTEGFRQFAIYHYGNFKMAFRLFHFTAPRGDADLETSESRVPGAWARFVHEWDVLFKPVDRPELLPPVGLRPIREDMVWALGYLAISHSPGVEKARARLLPLLRHLKQDGVKDYEARVNSLRKISHTFREFDGLHDSAFLPPSANLYELSGAKGTFDQRLDEAIRICQDPIGTPTDPTSAISRIQADARSNTFAYLTVGPMDVYFATSMRSPQQFYNTRAVVGELFDSGRLKEWGVRVFDPTQSFSHDRLDKGLVESLMITRSKLTVYNAQDVDTFGKDSEAAVSLAQRHPVIVYVARLFEKEMLEEYSFLNDLAQLGTEGGLDLNDPDVIQQRVLRDYVDCASRCGYSEASLLKFEELSGRPTTLDEIVRAFVSDVFPGQLRKRGLVPVIRDEIVKHGFYPTEAESIEWLRRHRSDWLETLEKDRKSGKDAATAVSTAMADDDFHVTFCTGVIQRLESRAVIFRLGHPLSLQTSPLDGVARGVFVTRSVPQTRMLIQKLLTRSVSYQVRRDKYCWKLVDVIGPSDDAEAIEGVTSSAVRVITADPTLTAAYWQSFYSVSRPQDPVLPAWTS